MYEFHIEIDYLFIPLSSPQTSMFFNLCRKKRSKDSSNSFVNFFAGHVVALASCLVDGHFLKCAAIKPSAEEGGARGFELHRGLHDSLRSIILDQRRNL